MQLLYVVKFEVAGEDAYERILSHIAEWLTDEYTPLTSDSFHSGGSQTLRTAYVNGQAYVRHGTWEVVELEGTQALKLEVSQAADQAALELTTRVTVSEVDGEVQFRVGIGRENVTEQVVPVTETDVFQPGIVRTLAYDPDLTLRRAGQLVLPQYITARTPEEAIEIAASLPLSTRLPLVLVHARTHDMWETAKALSRKLLGLAQVVTVNFDVSSRITAAHPSIKVPFGGLMLVWPGMSAEPVDVSLALMDTLGADGILRLLTGRLGALSALGNGTDARWRQAKSAADKAKMQTALQRAERARVGGDTQEEIKALKQQIEILEDSKAELEAIGEEALTSVDARDRRISELEVQLEKSQNDTRIWREAYQESGAQEPAEPEDPWTRIATLEPKKDPTATFRDIAKAASSHIVFTERASKSWSDIAYPEPADMTEKLIALAHAAVALYADDLGAMGRLDDWFKEKQGLNVALTDQTITDWKKKEFKWLNAFEFEGEVLNATPHVKVRDGVKLNECGRIHFALEPKKKRIVVHYVAVKTYS
ncbi:hypothetical protein [Microbacterium sp. Mcb102]|uniref:hypothetical protein n=1 Tax=Microbacterium sp. Mcb102 TaxID=2926012 RepID=UPI0021C8E2BD|nr:hypothetical protein [Microbacterium sp. Mcb102]